MGAEPGGLPPTPRRCRHEEGELLRRIVGVVRYPLPGTVGPGMDLDALVVEEDLHGLPGPLRPHLPADVSRRQGVVGSVEDDVVVGMDGALLPEGPLEGRVRKGRETMLLLREEDLVGPFLRRAVDLPSDLLPAPVKGAVVRLGDIPEDPAGEEVLPDGGNDALHLALVLRRPYPGGIGDEAEVALHVRVCPVHRGIVDVRLHHTGPEVVEDNPLRHAAEEGKGPLVAVEPGVRVLAKDEADEPVAARGEGHDEGPCPSSPFPLRVVHETGVPEVDLGLLARGRLHADRHLRPAVGELLPQVSPERRVAHLYAEGLLKEPPHLLARHVRVIEPCLYVVVMAGEEVPGGGIVGGAAGVHHVLQPGGELMLPGERALPVYAGGPCHADIFADGLPVDAE